MIAVTRQLIDRRVPHFVGLYLGASWGAVQFVDFVERYGFSPHWTNLTLVFALLLLPSVLLFSYHHGRPGKDQWQRSEKVAVPLNLLIAIAILFTVFHNKDLGAVTTSVITTDETGKSVEGVVAKASFRRRLALFNFDAPAGDTAAGWLRYGLPVAVATDLAQDMFIEVYPSAVFKEKLRQLGHADEVNVPLSLKRTIAQERHLPYFTVATVSRKGDQIAVDFGLYETESSALVKSRTYTGTDVLAIADEMSNGLKQDLGVPQTAKVPDLPVAEALTSSPAAFRQYAEAVIAIQINGQWRRAAQLLEQAVQTDSTFALAWYTLHNVYALSDQAKAMPPLQKTMDNLYRVPERSRFGIKVEYYMMKQEKDKAYAVAKMNVDLHPEDLAGYALLSQFQLMRDEKDGIIASYKKMLELDPTQQERLVQIGGLYEGQGKLDEALKYYEDYARRFPNKPETYLSIGNVVRRLGDHARARENYEKAQIIAPEDIAAQVMLASLEEDLGNFEVALRQHQEALAAAKSAEDRAKALAGLADHYEMRGELTRAIDHRRQLLQEQAKTQPPFLVAIRQLQSLGTYARAGQVQSAQQILKRVKSQLQPPFNTFGALGEMELEVELEHPDAAERAAAALEQGIKALGFQTLQSFVVRARGSIAEQRGQCDQAISLWEEKLKMTPTDLGIHSHIGRCYRKLGQPQKAIEHNLVMLEVVPFQPRANYEIGLAYLDAGDRAKGREHLARAAQVWSNADATYKLPALAKAKLREVEAMKAQ